MIAIPTKPAAPISLHSKIPMTIESSGPVHIEFIHIVTHSNRLTSFERRFTTLPGDVSPSAVCDRHMACLQNVKLQPINQFFIHTESISVN